MRNIDTGNLFDPILDEDIPTSGNNDPADDVKAICAECGRANGEHDINCDAWFDSILTHL